MSNDQFEWIICLIIFCFIITSASIAIIIMELSQTKEDIKAIKEKLFEDTTKSKVDAAIVKDVKEYEQRLLRWIQRSPDMGNTTVDLGEMHYDLREAIYGKQNKDG